MRNKQSKDRNSKEKVKLKEEKLVACGMGSSYYSMALGAERGQIVILQTRQDPRDNCFNILGVNYSYHPKASRNNSSIVDSIFRSRPNIFRERS